MNVKYVSYLQPFQKKVVGHGQEFDGSEDAAEDRPLRCYTGALGGRIATTCDADVKHCTIHITSE